MFKIFYIHISVCYYINWRNVLKLSEERERGIIMEIGITVFEYINLAIVYFILNHLLILIFFIGQDVISNLRHKFDINFIEKSITELKNRKVNFGGNYILYLLRSISYVICCIMIFEIASTSDDTILYFSLIPLIVISKLHREELIHKLHLSTSEFFKNGK